MPTGWVWFLATQNPVDLDYKGLSNTGTWFIGRLQTERDKMRVMEGLEGTEAGGAFNRQEMEQVLAGLGKRRFLLYNVHEDQPVIFNTRWAMSYLTGPLTREQIKKLINKKALPKPKPKTKVKEHKPQPASVAPPALPPDIKQFYLPITEKLPRESTPVYKPMLMAGSEICFNKARYELNKSKRLISLCEILDGPVPVDWAKAMQTELAFDELDQDGREGASFEPTCSPCSQCQKLQEMETDV